MKRQGYGLAAALLCLCALAGAVHFRLLPLTDEVSGSGPSVSASIGSTGIERWRYLPILR